MGIKDAVSKQFLSDAGHFAQICNNELFNGQPFIQPEKLRELDPEELALLGIQVENLKSLEKYRDILRIYDDKVLFLILGIENQSGIHYAMPLRQMLYDVLKYESQRAALEREHRLRKDLKDAEYLSGMAKTDRLVPVISIVVYWGKEPWNGPKTLHEMLDIPSFLGQYNIINDYHMNLLEVCTMENLSAYSGGLKALLGFIRYQDDKVALNAFVADNEPLFRSIPPETIRAISVLGNAQELKKYITQYKTETGEEAIDMCQALQEIFQDGKKKGWEEGQKEASAQLLSLITSMSSDGLVQEIPRLSTEPDYLTKMLKKYQLS